VRRAESIQSLAGSPDAKAFVRVEKMTGDLLPATWGETYPARLGIFPPGLDFAAVKSAFRSGVAPHPVELHVDYSVRSAPTPAARDHTRQLRQAIDALRKEIYREYGVHIVLAAQSNERGIFSLPRDAIIGGGLRAHFKIVKTIVEVRNRAQITSRRFHDADVTAADWWYGMTAEQIDRYLRIDKGNGYSRELMSGREALSNLPRRRMVGRLPHLPVSEATFDETAVNQIIYWLDGMDPKLADASLRDLIRVTRPGGRVRIGQVNNALYERFAKILAAERPDVQFRYAERGNNVLLIDLP